MLLVIFIDDSFNPRFDRLHDVIDEMLFHNHSIVVSQIANMDGSIGTKKFVNKLYKTFFEGFLIYRNVLLISEK